MEDTCEFRVNLVCIVSSRRVRAVVLETGKQEWGKDLSSI